MADQVSLEDQEALRQMMEGLGHELPDRRAESDPSWFANGVLIELHSLSAAAHLNGQIGEVIGYDDEQRRYRVQLQSDKTVKVVAKKNMRMYVPPLVIQSAASASSVVGAPPVFLGGTDANEAAGLLTGPASGLQLGPTSAGEIAIAAQTTTAELVPSRDTVQQLLGKFNRERLLMLQRCAARQVGSDVKMCEGYVEFIEAWDSYSEALECYQKYHGEDPALKGEHQQADAAFEECYNLYTSVRTWTEYALDEVNLTKHNIRRHGVVGTLKNEVVGIGTDAVEVAQAAAETAPVVGQLVRQGTANIGSTVASGAQTAHEHVRNTSSRAGTHAVNTMREQVVGPFKRAWHLMLTGFLMCYLIPLFALRTYAPLNSVVANLGGVYAIIFVACPPRWVRGRSAKAGFIVLYPLVLVVLPLALHYWATHPPSGMPGQPALPYRQMPWHQQAWDPPATSPSPAPAPAAGSDIADVGTPAPARGAGGHVKATPAPPSMQPAAPPPPAEAPAPAPEEEKSGFPNIFGVRQHRRAGATAVAEVEEAAAPVEPAKKAGPFGFLKAFFKALRRLLLGGRRGKKGAAAASGSDFQAFSLPRSAVVLSQPGLAGRAEGRHRAERRLRGEI